MGSQREIATVSDIVRRIDDGEFSETDEVRLLSAIRREIDVVLYAALRAKADAAQAKLISVGAQDAAASALVKADEAKNKAILAEERARLAEIKAARAEIKSGYSETNVEFYHLEPQLESRGIIIKGVDKTPGRLGHVFAKCNHVARKLGYDPDLFPVGAFRDNGFPCTKYPMKVISIFAQTIRDTESWYKWFEFRD